MHLRLRLLPGELAVCRLPADAPIPAWATAAPFFCVVRTADELSVVCAAGRVPTDADATFPVARGWRALRVAGPLDLALVGVMARLAVPLADAGVSVLPIATFDTDYLLVRAAQLPPAVAALRAAGHEVGDEVGDEVDTHGAPDARTDD